MAQDTIEIPRATLIVVADVFEWLAAQVKLDKEPKSITTNVVSNLRKLASRDEKTEIIR